VNKRKITSGSSRTRKRLGWILGLTALIVIVVIYETSQELRKEHAARDPDLGQAPTQEVDSAIVPARKAQARVKSYYLSHDLPPGWTVGDTIIVEPNRVELALFFAPSIGDRRHGQAAPAGDISAMNACPLDAALLREIAGHSLWIKVNDKTGLIDSFACPAAGGL
jgi:hypothetical protein